MTMIGMKEAAERMGVKRTSALRALRNAGLTITTLGARFVAVERAAFEAFMVNRPQINGQGRPKGSKNRRPPTADRDGGAGEKGREASDGTG